MAERERGAVLLIGGDLMARSRLQDAAGRQGLEVRAVGVDKLDAALARARPALLVLDLDAGRDAVLDRLEEARREGLVPDRVIGYFSHVDEALGEAAQRAGCEALPRGRFWRELPSLLAGSGHD